MALLIKAAALFAAVSLSAPAADEAPTAPPVDMVARAKAPKEAGELIDGLQAINKLVNDRMQGESDLQHYGMNDLWVMFPPDGKGDCEDYALTKLGYLQQLGYPIIADAKIATVIVHSKRGTEGHAILALRLPHKTVIYLDNMNPEPMTRRELVKAGYEFFDWRA